MPDQAAASATPSITTQPQSQSVVAGSNAVFTVIAGGQGTLDYQWSLNGINLTDSAHISGATSATLTISNVLAGDAGNYQVVVSNSHGSVTSSNATLTVLVPAGITAQPVSQAVLLSSNAAFTVSITGTAPLSCQWYFNGTPLTDGGRVSGAGTTNLNVASVQTNDAGSYQLVVTNSYGSSTSVVATLTVLLPPSFISQPANQSVILSSNTSFAVSIAGTAPLSNQWYLNDVPLSDGNGITGSTSTILNLSNVQTNEAGSYQIIVTNNYGSATSIVASLTVLLPPSIVTSPTNQRVLEGGSVSFKVAATGTEPLYYQWQMGGIDLTNGNRINGATNSTLTISDLQFSDSGQYRVVVTNAYGSVTSSNTVLTVLVPAAIAIQPSNQTTYFSGPANFSVVAIGTAPLSYQWLFNGVPLADGGQIAGAATATLNIANVQTANLGNYQVVVTNNYGMVTSAVATLNATNRVHYVNSANPNPAAPYTDWNTAAVNIQDAVGACVAGDLVLVTNGVYQPGGAITVTIPISVASVSGPAQTIIDGGGANRCVYLGGEATLAGFTLTNGYTTQNGGDVYCESTNETLVNCVLSGGRAGVPVNYVGGLYYYGGGVYGGTLSNCTLIGNWASQSGGGALGSTLYNCIVASNSANSYQGGGVDQCTVFSSTLSGNGAGQWGGNASESTLVNCWLSSGSANLGAGARTSTLINCVLSNNISVFGQGGGANACSLADCLLIGNSAGWSGGGADGSTLANCLVLSNTAPVGGGLSGGSATNCSLIGNSANDSYTGGGGGASGGSLYNCLIAGNSSVLGAGGVEQGTLVNCTVAGNSANSDGGGVDSSTLTNCIVYFNTSPVNGNYSGTNYMSWCCTTPLPNAGPGDAVIGVSNLSSAPVFVDAASSDFRLAAGSPGLDAGNVAAAPGAVDLAGNPRTVNGTVDMGAYESQNAPLIAIQPTNQTVPFGEPSVSLSAVVIGQGVVAYQWRFNGTNILDATNSTLVLNFVQYRDAGLYSVLVTNKFGVATSSNAVLTVVPPTPPAFATQPSNQIVPVGTNVVLTALANGAPAPVYRWYFNGRPLEDDSHYAGTGSTTLQISNVQTGDTGNYFVVATNIGGAATSAVANVTVFIPAAILSSPVSQTQLQGSNATFTAVASGSPPLGDQWFFNGIPLMDGGQFSGTATTNLTITDVQSTNGGNYVFVVTNNYSSATSEVATLTVVFPAVIAVQPTNQTVLAGSNVTFAVIAGGTTPLNYRWYANGVALTNSGRISGATSANLTIAAAQADDRAAYQVVVTNNYSSVTSQVATLTVLVPAQITGQPSSQAVLLGTNASFTVTATGSTPLRYQWYLNSTPLTDGGRISGSTTPTLNISNIQSSDAGGYVAVVTNLWGAATSRTASLTPLASLGPSVRYVALTSTNPRPPYLDWSTAATNIQDAVDAAVAGDTILVTNGVYNAGGRAVYGGATNRLTVDKAVTVQSVNGPLATLIVGGPLNPGGVRSAYARCAYLTNGAALIGFTLTNGGTAFTGDVWKEQSGGGVWCESPAATVSNCVLSGNVASQYGGGAAGGTLFNCVLTNNRAGGGGGAASNTLFNCTLTSNTALNQGKSAAGGGGAYGCVLNHCWLVGNQSPFMQVPGNGGGAAFSALTGCVVSNNTAYFGGGVFMGVAEFSLISSNRAVSLGGGAYSNVLNNCILRNNVADGAGGAYDSALINCTVVSNASWGLWGGAATNSIIYYNGPGGNVLNSMSIVSSCTIPLGSVTNEPLFVNLAGGDFHLQSNSPCINSGNNAYVTVTNDLDGNPRIVGGTVDMGAYEFQSPSSVLSYAWAQQYGLPTDGSVDYADLDGTGFNVYQDWIAGLNPTNALSILAMLPPVPTNNPVGLVVSWESVSNRTYFLQSSTNLAAQPAFSTIQSNIVGQADATSYTDTNATGEGPYFYRVGVQ